MHRFSQSQSPLLLKINNHIQLVGFLLVCQDVPPELFTSKQLLHHRLLLLSPRDSARVEVCRPTHYTSNLGGEEKEINIGSTPPSPLDC